MQHKKGRSNFLMIYLKCNCVFFRTTGIIMLNNRLAKMGVIVADSCSFCNRVKENYAHFFWECDIVQKYWEDVLHMIIIANFETRIE